MRNTATVEAHLVQEQDKTVKAMRGGNSYTVKTSNIGRKPRETPPSETHAVRQEALTSPIDALNIFRTLCLSFSALPEPRVVANLIKDRENFRQWQAHRMVRWFDCLAMCLAEGDSHWECRSLLRTPSAHDLDYSV
jgi:hypothetical protein